MSSTGKSAKAHVVVPGTELGAATAFAAGPGTYVRDGKVLAAVVGVVRTLEPADDGMVRFLQSAVLNCGRR